MKDKGHKKCVICGDLYLPFHRKGIPYERSKTCGDENCKKTLKSQYDTSYIKNYMKDPEHKEKVREQQREYQLRQIELLDPKTCVICGNEYKGRKGVSVTCSETCADLYRLERIPVQNEKSKEYRREYYKEYYQRNKENLQEQHKEYREKNKEKIQEYYKKSNMKRKMEKWVDEVAEDLYKDMYGSL